MYTKLMLIILLLYLQALGHDISKRFVTKFKRIMRRPIVSGDKWHYDRKGVSCDNVQFNA